MKRKRREVPSPPLLDDVPKRPKLQAQRKFAQNCSVNSPIISPIRDLESENLLPNTSALPEPVELLPMKRPNTEDFLTFLCFRGTPILPPSLNFFNTASIVSDGQVHEIKGDASPKNGPIDIAKCSGASAEKPFIAFGVRKRADPIVISKQMERKRRHALALQALRRKYQEQKMAKIRALTISKLSEKTTNKTTVKTNTIQKTETVTKKDNITLQKTKVIATKHVKVTTQTLKTALRPKVKPKMCLRSFRGRIVQKELPFRGRQRIVVDSKEELKKKGTDRKKNENKEQQKIDKANKVVKSQKYTEKKHKTGNARVTRSGMVPAKATSNFTRQQLKKRILLSTTYTSKPIVKSKLRSSTLKSTVISQKKCRQGLRIRSLPQVGEVQQKLKIPVVSKRSLRKDSNIVTKKTFSRDSKDDKGLEAVNKTSKSEKKEVKRNVNIKKTVNATTKSIETKKNIEIKKSTKFTSEKQKSVNLKNLKKEVNKSSKKTTEVFTNRLRSKGSEQTNKVFSFNSFKNKDFKKAAPSTDIKTTIGSKNKKSGDSLRHHHKIEEIKQKQRDENKQHNNAKISYEKESNTKEIKDFNDKCSSKTTKNIKDYVKLVQKPEKILKKENLIKLEEKVVKIEKKDAEIVLSKVQTITATDQNFHTLENSEISENTQDNFRSKCKILFEEKESENIKLGVEDRITENILDNGNISTEIQLNKLPENENKESRFVKGDKPKEVLKKTKLSANVDIILSAESAVKEILPATSQKLEDKSKEIKTIIVDNSKRMVPLKKLKLPMNASVRKKELKKQITEDSTQKISQRPSRKTKEAAAIYMEILSHKLVSDETFDDDNNSIDSFPELPNARKTEQRENELKAQAKTTCNKERIKELPEIEEVIKIVDKKDKKTDEQKSENLKVQENVPKGISIKMPIEEMSCSEDKNKKITKQPQIDLNNKNLPKPELISIKKEDESESVKKPPEEQCNKKRSEEDKLVEKKNNFKKQSNEAKLLERKKRFENQNEEEKIVKNSTDKSSPDHIEETIKFGLRKRKSYQETFIDFDSESDEEILQEKVKKLTMQKLNKKESPEVLKKRQTRGVTKIFVESYTDTDETFYADVRVPRNKKLTRSKAKISLSENSETELTKDKKSNKKEKLQESESGQSVESDTNLKSLQLKQSKKILAKSLNKSKKSSGNFSDSDEEPLSKLTADKSVKSCTESEDCKTKRIKKKYPLLAIRETKPKRECARRPQNYLPMPSSSEDEEYFHGFTTTTVKEEIKQPITYVVETLPPSLDLLEKDLGRKGKVNMSNEQIEQWLKDSALAGSGVAKENDEMLKFGEKIPVERNIPIQEEISENVTYKMTSKEVKNNDIVMPCPSITPDIDKPTKSETKSSPGDRKLIFRKEKKEATPTISAFSPENERSVYAFGDDIEETVSTPFRRPSRRPSSTATSKSEDESSKNEESLKQGQFRKPPPQVEHADDFRCFNVPQNPSSSKLGKQQKWESMVPPASIGKKPSKLHIEKFPESFDEGKYKVPSSPSASSSSSAKLSKKSIPKPRNRAAEVATPIYLSDFPKTSEPGKLVEAPVFHPTEQEFQDPLEYIERIRHKAEQFGICKIVPPSTFKPECKVSDEMRFTSYNQYVHKMLHRWGPNFKEFMAIKKYLTTQNITLKQPPWIGGMEIDLPRLYQTVQSLGGLKEVIEKKKWSKVSDCMKIPKSAQDRVTKLDDIYCKYLLPYDTLSPAEREKLFDEVETDWAKRESKNFLKTDEKVPENSDEEQSDDEVDECIVKGRNMALSAFYRIARNTMAMHFKTAEPTAHEVEEEFWKYVTQKQNYICVHSASIDCGVWGYGFAVTKNSPFGKHAWNLKVLSNNNHSVLKSLGPAMGVTVPTLHVGMVFSACCWYRDPHGLPWVEYLHTGGSKIWYAVPNTTCGQFYAALKKLVPNYCRDKELWLPSDTAMVPPSLLMENNVSLSRSVQEPGQFIVVFPKVFTSSISTGYVVSESVYYAPHYWLKSAKSIFSELKSSCEPSMFSLDKLLLKIAADPKSNVEVLRIITPYIQEMYLQEKDLRNKLRVLGKIEEEKITSPEAIDKKKRKFQFGNEVEFECEICRTNLYVSMVIESQNDLVYCLEHAIEVAEKDQKLIEFLKIQYNCSERELEEITFKISTAIEAKIQKKTPNKFAGISTVLTK